LKTSLQREHAPNFSASEAAQLAHSSNVAGETFLDVAISKVNETKLFIKQRGALANFPRKNVDFLQGILARNVLVVVLAAISLRRYYGFYCASRHNSHMFISRRRGAISV
jgi:hypothetical protein